ncbi:hypothetical protein SARC_01925 [Sphaeroforma arctica JP610]|uniref:RRM domain-containing protein n=1 Tax=Sphaeroforma arctica JP610 TaxID=667725 RepID=A0A0L0GA23_9EUKA|nr:hypothetical protein SARC_01925 [Sphaeroforma arctica JP610]KNC85887.1 hypothetical protein SARC_01925 [Sphaeroforma arctica JP610]|eukprot:XP_014159789.1 hypothetical protein SARC_01925 [Sphaeroforma arctica JP610]
MILFRIFFAQHHAPKWDRTGATRESETEIFVRRVPHTADNATLKAAYADCGAKSASLFLAKWGPAHRGYGVVTFSNKEDVMKALSSEKKIGDQVLHSRIGTEPIE